MRCSGNRHRNTLDGFLFLSIHGDIHPQVSGWHGTYALLMSFPNPAGMNFNIAYFIPWLFATGLDSLVM